MKSKRVAAVLAATVCMTLATCEPVFAQLQTQVTANKSITTTEDTTLITTRDLVVVELTVTHDGAGPDTLLWRTENVTGYFRLLPGEKFHASRMYAKRIYRKATGGTIYSRLQAN